MSYITEQNQPPGWYPESTGEEGGGGITPTGTKYITIEENGTTTEDVTEYASAEITVDVQGDSLPSSISAIDGGSFTLASDTKCSAYSIATTLNVPAKYFLIWTDELNSAEAISYRSLVVGFVYIRTFEYSTGVTRYGAYYNLQRQTNGGAYHGASTLNYAHNPEQFTNNNMINFYVGDTYYLAGVTYKWIALA